MDIQAARGGNVEDRLGKDQSVRRDHQDVDSRFAQWQMRIRKLQRGRLIHRDAATCRQGVDSARKGLQPAAGGPVGLAEDEGDFVAGIEQRLERPGGEGWGAGEGDAQGGGAWRGYAALRWRFFSLARMRFNFSSDKYSTKILPWR